MKNLRKMAKKLATSCLIILAALAISACYAPARACSGERAQAFAAPAGTAALAAEAASDPGEAGPANAIALATAMAGTIVFVKNKGGKKYE